MRCPYEGMKGNLSATAVTIAAGESVDFEFTSAEGITLAQRIGYQLFVMGWIEYRDDSGVVRRTAFCREFKPGPLDDGRFCPVSDPDYEYED